MVVICLPSAALTGSEHERVATPLMCTVQAPHCAMPQPYLVPVMPSESRSTQSKGVSGSTSTLWVRPLIDRDAMCMLPLVAVVDPHRSDERQLVSSRVCGL